MNKKFLSAILFGALMVSSTGTFVSCKDYDDDIESINKELGEVKSQIAALQAKVDAGKYITGVNKTDKGLTFTLSDGSTYEVTNGAQGAAGAAGDKISINEDGYFVLNGKVQEWKAVTKDQLGQVVKVKTPTISADGCWVFYDEKGEAHPTTIKVAPVSAVQNEDKSWTLTVWSADGKSQTIKLPTAASMITETEVLGRLYTSQYGSTADNHWYPLADAVTGIYHIPYNFTLVTQDMLNRDDVKAWNKEEGVKKLVKGQALSTLASYSSNFVVRIAPATLDASELSFALVNSQSKNAPVVLGKPQAYNGLLTRAAVSGNGLWVIPVSAEEGKVYKNKEAYMSQFEVNGVMDSKKIVFALREEGGFTSNFDLSFTHDQSLSLTTACAQVYSVELNKQSSVRFVDPSVVYDAHIHFSKSDVIRWGIVYNGGVNFTVTKLADQVTPAPIKATVHFVTLDGQVHETEVTIRTQKVNSNLTELKQNTILVKADNSKNNFVESLAPMFSNLGETATTLWRDDVKSADVTLYRVKKDNERFDVRIDNATSQVAVSYDKSKLGDINKIKVALVEGNTLERNTNYYLLINYTDVNGSVLSTLKVPFMITIPTINELLAKEKVVFNGTNNGVAVLNDKDLNAAGDAIYSLKYAFVGQLKNTYSNGSTVKFAIDPYQSIKVNGVNKKMNTLVSIVNNETEGVQVQLTDKENAYNKAINMQVSSASYLGKYAYTAEELKAAAFTLKVVSPIEQGTLEAAGGANAIINVVATEDGKAKISESDLVAKTYAGVAYKVFMDKFNGTDKTATGWTSPYIKANAEFVSTNENVFTMGEVKAATKDNKGVVIPGYVVVQPQNVAYEDAVPVKITLTDAWGYKKVVKINVKVSPKK